MDNGAALGEAGGPARPFARNGVAVGRIEIGERRSDAGSAPRRIGERGGPELR